MSMERLRLFRDELSTPIRLVEHETEGARNDYGSRWADRLKLPKIYTGHDKTFSLQL